MNIPNSEKIYVELDRASVGGRNVRGGLAGLGLLERVHQRTYRLTTAGLTAATEVIGAAPSMRAKAERTLADAIRAILSHPVFNAWMQDPQSPKSFRDAGHFWGVAPGTPPAVIHRRIVDIDHTLEKARSMLDKGGSDAVAASHARVLFDRTDVERANEFQAMLKSRFKKDLATLDVVLP